MFDAKIEIYCKQFCSLAFATPGNQHILSSIFTPSGGLFLLYSNCIFVWPVEHCNEKPIMLVITFFHPTIEQFHVIPCQMAGVSFYLPTNL